MAVMSAQVNESIERITELLAQVAGELELIRSMSENAGESCDPVTGSGDPGQSPAPAPGDR